MGEKEEVMKVKEIWKQLKLSGIHGEEGEHSVSTGFTGPGEARDIAGAAVATRTRLCMFLHLWP